jgi:hypothetical protein
MMSKVTTGLIKDVPGDVNYVKVEYEDSPYWRKFIQVSETGGCVRLFEDVDQQIIIPLEAVDDLCRVMKRVAKRSKKS